MEKIKTGKITTLDLSKSEHNVTGSEKTPSIYQNRSITIKTPSLSLFVARSNSGKSHLMKSILYTLARENKFSWVYVFSSTKFNNEWVDIVGEKNVTDQFSAEWIQELLNKQGELIKKNKAKPGLLILDDMIGTARWNSDVMTKIATSARHYNISCWISTQWYFKISTTLRGNCNYMFILNNISEKQARVLFEEFPTANYRKWIELQDFANRATVNYGVLMYDNTQGNPIINVIRAPPKIPDYTLKELKKPNIKRKT
jgi:hypothetical protein